MDEQTHDSSLETRLLSRALTAGTRSGERSSMGPRHLVATVLVEPSVVEDLELRVMTDDMWLWPVRTAPVVIDGARMESQLRRRLVEQRAGAWDDAARWTPAWVGFGDAWHEFGPEGNVRPSGPLPWAAHQRLWSALDEFAPLVRYRRRLTGIPTVPTSEWPGLHLR